MIKRKQSTDRWFEEYDYNYPLNAFDYEYNLGAQKMDKLSDKAKKILSAISAIVAVLPTVLPPILLLFGISWGEGETELLNNFWAAVISMVGAISAIVFRSKIKSSESEEMQVVKAFGESRTNMGAVMQFVPSVLSLFGIPLTSGEALIQSLGALIGVYGAYKAKDTVKLK
jgi:chromate transport protein ChrA